MEQKEPSVLSPEGSFTFGGVGRRENKGEDVAVPQMEDDLALCTYLHPPPADYSSHWSGNHNYVLSLDSWDSLVSDMVTMGPA